MTREPAAVAALPMYDWPEVRAATDALWSAIRDALAGHGLPAPEALVRTTSPDALWRDPNLVLGQACGLPFSLFLRGRVHVLASGIYALGDVPPGDYCSRIVTRADDARAGLADFRGATAAVNAVHSQSGHAALADAVAATGGRAPFFAGVRVSGAHRASIAAVAAGEADIAAIDAVSWELARRNDPAARQLRVLQSTPPRSGLPFVCAHRFDPDTVRAALAEAIDALGVEHKNALFLNGLKSRDAGDYAGFTMPATPLVSG